jgi:hypothetical protein
MPDLKRCCRCHVEMPATPEYFWRSRQMKSGLQGSCKTCDGYVRTRNMLDSERDGKSRKHGQHCAVCVDMPWRRKLVCDGCGQRYGSEPALHAVTYTEMRKAGIWD